jgi:hypothetical protein
MKKIICSSLILLAFISNLWADDCAACRTKKYKFVFCDPNQTTSPYKTLKFCSDNPYQTAQEKNLQVVKFEGPICFTYEKTSFPYSDIVKRKWQYDYIIPKSVDPTDGNFLVFYPYAMEEGQPVQITNPIHRARDSWNNICQIQQNGTQCCIKISWEKNLGLGKKSLAMIRMHRILQIHLMDGRTTALLMVRHVKRNVRIEQFF